MRWKWILILTLAAGMAAAAVDDEPEVDNNTAFYEGERYSFIISPPDNFIMIDNAAIADGYSFAFIADGETYDSASVIIGINIFAIKPDQRQKFALGHLVTDDTLALRKHFGPAVRIAEVDPMVTENDWPLRTIYLNDTSGFVPNVMLSYLNGETDVLVFELSISENFPRFMAEGIYRECIERIKVMPKGKLGFNDGE